MEQFTLGGQVALITGASRGFGRAIAEVFGDAGADLALTYRQASGGCDAIAESVRARGQRCTVLRADVTDEREVEQAVAQTLDEHGKIDILVNNAGTMQLEPFRDSGPASWRADIDVNVFGAMNVTHAVLPGMVERKHGRIINLSSQLALSGWHRAPVYAGTKGFVLTWTKSLAQEVGQFNINVNAIGPGAIITDMNSGVYANEEAQRARLATLPLRRFGAAADVANSALFLASEAGGFLTGQMVSPNGGGVM